MLRLKLCNLINACTFDVERRIYHGMFGPFEGYLFLRVVGRSYLHGNDGMKTVYKANMFFWRVG